MPRAPLAAVALCALAILSPSGAFAADAGPESKSAGPPGFPPLPSPTTSPELFKAMGEAIPLPLLFGARDGAVGSAVEFLVTGAGERPTRVRVALVDDKAGPARASRQYELDYLDTDPRVLMVFWVKPGERPTVERMAIWVPPQPPISVPMDVELDDPRLKADLPSPASVKAVTLPAPFAGPAREVTLRTPAGAVQLVESDQAPPLKLTLVRRGKEVWKAVAKSTGAISNLGAVPLPIPRPGG